MSILIYLFQEPITVDRIEGEQVIIEWSDLSISSLPLDRFPSSPREGEQFIIRGTTSRNGSCKLTHNDPVILDCPNEILYLPIDIDQRMAAHRSLSLELLLSL